MAQCPRCSRKMDYMDPKGINLDVCPACRGIWFDAEELMQVVSMDAMALSALPFYGELQAGGDLAWEQPPAFCPRRSSALEPERFDKDLAVIVDVCPREHGFWLDQGELHRIKEYCFDAVHIKKEGEDIYPEHIRKMMEKHKKSLKRFHITYGVPDPPEYPGGVHLILPFLSFPGDTPGPRKR